MENLLNYIQPFLNSNEDYNRYHWCFVLFLTPQYIMNIHYFKDLYQLNQVEMRHLVKTMKKRLFDRAIEEEITHNPVPVPLSTVTAT